GGGTRRMPSPSCAVSSAGCSEGIESGLQRSSLHSPCTISPRNHDEHPHSATTTKKSPRNSGAPSRPPAYSRKNAGGCGKRQRFQRGGRDLNASGPGAVERSPERSGPICGHLRVVPDVREAPESGSARATCSTVARDPGRGDEVAEALRKAIGDWAT